MAVMYRVTQEWVDDHRAVQKERDELKERIERVKRSLWSSLLEADVSPAFQRLAERIINTLEGK
jgi:hypothetical protein